MQPSSYSIKERYLLKVVLVGPAKAGKTALTERFVNNAFRLSYKATIGADFLVKDLSVNDNALATLQVWDTAGQERFRSLGTALYRRADAFVICVGPDDTADKLIEFLKYDVFLNMDSKNTLIVVAATKSDDLKENQLADMQGRLKSLREYLIQEKYTSVSSSDIVTSAKTGENVNQLFQLIATEVVNKIEQEKQADKIVVSGKQEGGVVYQPLPDVIYPESNNTLKNLKLVRLMLAAWKHFKHNPGRYATGLVLALGVAALLTIPGIGQAFGLTAAIGYLAASTAVQLGLFAAGIAVCAFLATLLGGYAIDKIKRHREASKNKHLLTQPISIPASSDNPKEAPMPILQQPNTANPIGAFSNSASTITPTQQATGTNPRQDNSL
jgi:Ras-related protein Rab-7A